MFAVQRPGYAQCTHAHLKKKIVSTSLAKATRLIACDVTFVCSPNSLDLESCGDKLALTIALSDVHL